jgi:OPA family glycerol-3-phosphate transporter-like MFS transporter/OPA family sugar phosphate sensor protein UhpC-like MFS transporter
MLARAINLLRPARPAPPVADFVEMHAQYRYWRRRILYTSLIGYALFYLVRKNLSVAMPVMITDLGITKEDLGIFLTLHGVCYGVSKFANGFLGDRTNPRYFMALGLLLSAAANVAFGLSSAVAVLGIFWLLNGWFQGMGFPPCARSLTHWFSAGERGTIFSIWNTSHSIGAALALVLCGYLVAGGWRLGLLVPAAIAIVGAVFLVVSLRDTPQSLGLPSIEDYSGEPCASAGGEAGELDDFRSFVIQNVFLNPAVWIVSVANFFVYTVRYAILDWGPTFLTETRGIHLSHASWRIAAYEIAGIAGMLASGWMTDRIFKGRGGRACFFSMVLCSLFLFLLWRYPVNSALASTALLCGVGFFIYGPQCLVGVIAANAATRRAAATAIGLTGLFGYLSGVLSGWGLGRIADRSGWDPVFRTLVGSAVVATVLFALCWNSGHGRRAKA